MKKTIVTSTGSRPIRFNGFLINPGEEKELPRGINIPDEYIGNVHIVRIEKDETLIINEKPIVLTEEQDLRGSEEIFETKSKIKRRNK